MRKSIKWKSWLFSFVLKGVLCISWNMRVSHCRTLFRSSSLKPFQPQDRELPPFPIHALSGKTEIGEQRVKTRCQVCSHIYFIWHKIYFALVVNVLQLDHFFYLRNEQVQKHWVPVSISTVSDLFTQSLPPTLLSFASPALIL